MDLTVPHWDQYFLGIARAVAARSKDPRTKVGCVLVDSRNRIVGTGYNGMAPGVSEEPMWEDKYQHVVHAEMNAALYRTGDPCSVYVTHCPCWTCWSTVLCPLGVKKIAFFRPDASFRERYHVDATVKRMLIAGVQVVERSQ